MDQQHCERCGEALKEGRIVWLELNSHTGRYAKADSVPPEQSQGHFPFGATCARKQLKEDTK